MSVPNERLLEPLITFPPGAFGGISADDVTGTCTGNGAALAAGSDPGPGPWASGLARRVRSGGAPIRVLLVISSLERGGAERQVVHLANALPTEGFEVDVCSLSPVVPLAGDLHEPDRLHILEKRRRFDVTVVSRAAALMRRLRVQIVHGFLFDAELVSRLAARAVKVPVVIASERNTDYRRPLMHAAALRLTRHCADLMIANSSAGARFNMRDLGLPAERIRVVHNGVDVMHFRPVDGMEVRWELNIPPGMPVIGMVASFKRQKNHAMFFRMARRLLERFPRARFLCIGEPLRDNQQGAADYHAEMRALVRELGLQQRVSMLGQRADMAAVYSACDVTVLTSTREGTPNVLLESMACGVPVVATDVADNRYVVPEDVGFVVPPRDDVTMAACVGRVLRDASLRRQMGERGRQWVQQEFSIAALARKTGGVYREWLRRKVRT